MCRPTIPAYERPCPDPNQPTPGAWHNTPTYTPPQPPSAGHLPTLPTLGKAQPAGQLPSLSTLGYLYETGPVSLRAHGQQWHKNHKLWELNKSCHESFKCQSV